MAVFIINNGLISRDSSVITGSLNVTSGITASFFGTASYVITSSYSLSSATASYTVATSIASSSYALTTVSASIAQTASTVNGLFFGPTQNIGFLSPNIYIGSATNNGAIQSTGSYAGTLLTPIMINKPCTLVTMSIVGAASSNTTCSLGIYTNSTASNLPEYLLAEGILRSAAVGSGAAPVVFNVSNFTPIKLQANTVYWVAFLANATGAFTRFIYMGANYAANVNNSIINPLLGNRISVSASVIAPHWCIRSGSFNPIVGTAVSLAPTASQSTSSYSVPTVDTTPITPLYLPVLKVTYP